jgi:hypothetical protein
MVAFLANGGRTVALGNALDGAPSNAILVGRGRYRLISRLNELAHATNHSGRILFSTE